MSTTRPVLLISARDAGAAHNMVPVIMAAEKIPAIEVNVAASGPACEIFRDRNVEFEAIDILPVAAHDEMGMFQLRRGGKEMLDRFAPAAVLCGSSGPDAGLDEALLLAEQNVPKYVLQDFWGDVNPAAGARADCYFVIDEIAAHLTRQRGAGRTEIVGAPKYTAYHDLDIAELRQAARRSAGVEDNEVIAIFFGQPHLPHAVYCDGVLGFYQAAASCAGEITPVYRPHPREDAEIATFIRSESARAGRDVLVSRDLTTEAWLAGCDLAATYFSNCAFDLAHLNRLAANPLAVMLCLAGFPGIRDSYREFTELETVPLADVGLMLDCPQPGEMQSACEKALREDVRTEIADSAFRLITSPEDAPERILKCIAADCFNGVSLT